MATLWLVQRRSGPGKIGATMISQLGENGGEIKKRNNPLETTITR